MSNKHHRSERDQILDRYVTWGIIIGALLATTVFVFEFVFPRWIPVMAPPETAVKLLAYQGGVLYIRTVSGNVYAYEASDGRWKRAEQVDPKASDNECNFGEFSTPRAPGKIVSQLESYPCIVDAASQVNLILLEDGSIWKWEKTAGEMDLLFVPIGVIVATVTGGSLGVVVGLVIGIVNWKLKKK